MELSMETGNVLKRSTTRSKGRNHPRATKGSLTHRENPASECIYILYNSNKCVSSTVFPKPQSYIFSFDLLWKLQTYTWTFYIEIAAWMLYKCFVRLHTFFIKPVSCFCYGTIAACHRTRRPTIPLSPSRRHITMNCRRNNLKLYKKAKLIFYDVPCVLFFFRLFFSHALTVYFWFYLR